MKGAIIVLYAIVVVLSVVLLWKWNKRGSNIGPESSKGAVLQDADQPPEQVNRTDRSLTLEGDQDARLGLLEERVAELTSLVNQIRLSAERVAIPAPEPTEADFMDKHRALLIQIIDEEQRKRAWEKAIDTERSLAASMITRFGLAEAQRPALEEFGVEYMRRVAAIFDECRSVSPEAMQSDPSMASKWSDRWEGLAQWAEGRISEVGGTNSGEMWGFWCSVGNSAIPQFQSR